MKLLFLWPQGMEGIFPLGMGYLINAVSRAREAVQFTIADHVLDSFSESTIHSELEGIDLVAISAWGHNLDNLKNYVNLIRSSTDAIILSGGPSSHLVEADYSVTGEGEQPLIEFVDWLSRDLSDDKFSVNKVFPKQSPISYPSKFTDNLDSLGLIDYSILRLNDYHTAGYKDWMYSLKDKFISAPIMTTRGCPYNCSYCQGPVLMGHKVRKHSVEYVLETIATLYERFSVRQISILDDNFTFHIDYAKKICEGMIKLREKNNWDFICTSVNGVRANRMDEELIALMKRAGWSEIVISPESGSERTLQLMNKRVDLADLNFKIELIHKHRMNVVGYFIAGYPGETRQDLEISKNYILNSNLDRAVLNFFNPTPGTKIYKELLKSGQIDSSAQVVNYKEIGFIAEDLTREDLMNFQDSISAKTRFREKWIRDL